MPEAKCSIKEAGYETMWPLKFTVSYNGAINWLAFNDDNGWLDDEYGRHLGEAPNPSTAALLVMYLFDASKEDVMADLRLALSYGSGVEQDVPDQPPEPRST
ncbi:MAG: hypothetical protein PGN33_14145 [Methylobacterium radiotolerans]